MVVSSYVGFIDASFLRAEGARTLGEDPRGLRLDAEGVVTWLDGLSYALDQSFLRAYWYDARFEPGHDHAEGQRRFFIALGQTPGIQVRLGHIVEYRPWFEPGIREAVRRTAAGVGLDPDVVMNEFDRHWTFRPERRQRGVDTLVATDLVRLASRSIFDTAVLISGDRDLAPVVETVQEYGCRVVIATPDRYCVAREMLERADRVIEIDEEGLHQILPRRSPPSLS